MEIGKHMTAPMGIDIVVITPHEWENVRHRFEADKPNWMPYDSQLVEMHITNCGYGILDAEYMTAIDDEFILDDIYKMLEDQKER